MQFQKGSRRQAIEYEKDLVGYWKQHRTFEKSVELRPKDNAYVFYDGPPFITGVPHHGTLLSSIVKDAVPRYWTMQGKRVERVWGWDCHGLPAEVFTEQKLGIEDKRDIGTKVTLEEYINTCRENMVLTGNEWEDTIDRIGRWVDFKGAYRTMDKDYMESVWWAFKQLYDAGKIYEGEKVLLYCTRDATPISKAEVAMDNSYQDVTDPSVYVKLRLLPERNQESGIRNQDESRPDNGQRITDNDVFLLAWTTTPWTLPANTAAAVNPDEVYAEVEVDGQKLIIAEALLEKVLTDEKHNVVPFNRLKTYKGKELVGRRYEPLFPKNEERRTKNDEVENQESGIKNQENANKVWGAEYVTLEEGTGIVHLAPAYGEEDYALAKQNNFPIIANIDDNGLYTSGEWQGRLVWDSNKAIAKALYERGAVWKIEYIRHSYPHCHRCGTRLMYRAHPSWFLNVDQQRERMLEQNGDITWFPGHIKQGRFAKTVQSAPDWNLSRDRFWATAMPVWKGIDNNGRELIKVVGSYAELKELSGVELDDYHRPWIDDVKFTIDNVEYTRIDKVLDCWFESGSMPFAQFHYPFENVEKFEQNFPGDFIAEYVGQVRAWFYYLHAVSVGLFDTHAFKNVIVTGTLAGNDGRKMSKSFGNFTDPNELMDRYGADALRFLLLSSPVLNGEDFSLQDKDVADVARKLGMIWNMYDFFTLYADVDQWDSGLAAGELPADPGEALTNPLDQWIVSRVHQLNQEVDGHVRRYDLPNALKPVLPFLDDASNWYVRRSRKRFWRSWKDAENQESGVKNQESSNEGAPDAGRLTTVDDKEQAYRTLHYVLVQLSLILAPFTPFLAEELYRKLTGGESVHLCDWPAVGHINELVVRDMDRTRQAITLGLAKRAEAGLKVRQPLAQATVWQTLDSGEPAGVHQAYLDILAEELNVKQVLVGEGAPDEAAVTNSGVAIALDLKLTPELEAEGLMREVVRNIQQARKQAGLEVDNRITLWLETADNKLATVLNNDQLTDTIKQETLSQQLNHGTADDAYNTTVRVDGAELRISLRKV